MNKTIIVVHSPFPGWGVIWEKLTFSDAYTKVEELRPSQARKYIREHGLIKVYDTDEGQVFDVADKAERYRKQPVRLASLKVKRADDNRGGHILEEYKQGVREQSQYLDLSNTTNKSSVISKRLSEMSVGDSIYIRLDQCCVATARGAAWKYKDKEIKVRTFCDKQLCYMVKELK